MEDDTGSESKTPFYPTIQIENISSVIVPRGPTLL